MVDNEVGRKSFPRSRDGLASIYNIAYWALPLAYLNLAASAKYLPIAAQLMKAFAITF